jgi:hypothetical protein
LREASSRNDSVLDAATRIKRGEGVRQTLQGKRFGSIAPETNNSNASRTARGVK